MNEVTVFSFRNQHEIRTVVRDGEPWFVAKDICDILDISNHRDAVANLDDDEKTVIRLWWNGNSTTCVNTVGSTDGIISDARTAGNPNVNIINESGFYALVFKSRKPEAKAFRKWVTSEVLPTIRKTGQYKAATANMTSNEFVSREFAALRSMAITAGLEGNAATVSANNAMVRIHSVSPLKLLQIELKNPDQQLFLTPTQIAQRLGFSGPREVNKLLAHEGFQSNINGTWVPTDKGRDYVVLLDTGKRHSDGVMIQQMKWKEKICDKLKPKRQSL